MATDSETRAIQDYLFANPSHLRTAQAVSDGWLGIKEVLCGDFLEHLRKAVSGRAKDLASIAPDLRVECTYGGERGWSSFLRLYRPSWPEWEAEPEHPPRKGRTAIAMQSGSPGPNGWNWGVLHALEKGTMTGTDQEMRARLERKLRSKLDGGRSDNWYSYVRSVDDEMGDWNSLLPDLYRERRDGGGPITDYYVGGIVGIATKAIPIINDVERAGG